MSVFHGLKVLITAGPTREAIDPVRYISNSSTGKMGYAIAELLHLLHAEVDVVSGPVTVQSNLPERCIIHVVTADEMLAVTRQRAPQADVIVFSAAVSDYKPATVAENKLKKTTASLTIQLVPNPDIAVELSKEKLPDQVFVGFALETEHGLEHAKSKLRTKKFDFIVLNMQNEVGSGFGHDTNKIQIIDQDEIVTNFPLASKQAVAVDIVAHLEQVLADKRVLA